MTKDIILMILHWALRVALILISVACSTWLILLMSSPHTAMHMLKVVMHFL